MRAITLVMAVGCGRIDFDGYTIDHDEDGDGVADAVDVCPHLAGSQADQDGDGVGDDCDPEPTIGRQRLLLFATLQPGDQPLLIFDPGWAQGPDAIHFDGTDGTGIEVPTPPFRNVRFAVAADIMQVRAPSQQHQLALHATEAASPHAFVELNEIAPSFSTASITSWDGASFANLASQTLPTGMHAGHAELQLTSHEGGAMFVDGGWPPSEVYHLQSASGGLAGAVLHIDINNLVVDVRYVWAVAW